jgi:hypothetical protein
MAELDQAADSPGKMRTGWHPLLVRVLNYELSSAYQVVDELPVGKMPLRVDILLVRRATGQLSDTAARDLSVLLPLLNRFTLVEFKGPTDQLETGDFAQLLGCSLLWHSQQQERIGAADISLIVVAPRITTAFRDEMALLNAQAFEAEPGVYRVEGLPFSAWVVETDPIAERGGSVLALFSRMFLQQPERIINGLMQSGNVLVLYFVFQQIQRFRGQGKEFAMQHAHADRLWELEEELKTNFLDQLSPEERLRGLPPEAILHGFSPEDRLRGLPVEDRLRGLPPEERLRGLPPEERLRGVPAEERLRGLSRQELKRLRELLDRQSEADDQA